MTRKPPRPEPAARDGQTLMRLGQRGGPWLWLSILAPVLAGFLLIAQAWLLADMLGRAIEYRIDPARLALPVGLFLLLLVLRAGLAALGDYAGSAAAERIKFGLRQKLFAGLLARSPRDPDLPPSGQASAAVVDQVEALDGFFARYVPAMVQAALLPLAFSVVILPLDWVAGLLFLVTAPLIPLFMALTGWGAQVATRNQARALSLLTGRFADRLRGLTTLKLLGRAETETRGIEAASDDLRRRSLGVLRIAFLASAVLEFFAALGVAGIALYVGLTFIGFFELRGSAMTLQLGLFLLLMAPEIYNPLRLLAAHYHDRAAARSALGEIQSSLGAIPSAAPLPAEEAPEAGGKLALSMSGLTLRTPDAARVVLEDVELALSPGEHLAILGPSGSGKSTLLEALARLRPYEGLVRLGDRDLADWPEAQLRHGVTLIGQKPRIFAASIARNIALARPDASPSAIRRAAELAHVADFADALPDGLDTMLGDGGLGLSGGQAHRVTLARLYLRQPGLILLDEPTAHLDSELEQQVLDDLTAFAQRRTLIVTTHSLAVAERMDKVMRIAGTSLLPAPLAVRRRIIA